MRHQKLCCLAGGLLFVSGAAFGQEPLARSGQNAHEAVKIEAIKRHTSFSESSRNNPSPPGSNTYQIAIGQILVNPANRLSISEDDLEILENLPGLTDASFLLQDRAELLGVCKRLLNSSRVGLDIADIALDMEKAMSNRELRIISHYVGVLEKISENSRELITTKMEEVQKNIRFTEMKLNFYAMAIEYPDLAVEIIADGCQQFEEKSAKHTPRQVRLKDEILNPQTNQAMTRE